MLNILFWNIDRKDVREPLCEIMKAKNAHVVVLTENDRTDEDNLLAIRSSVCASFISKSTPHSRFQVFLRCESLGLDEFHSSNRLSLRHLHYAKTSFLFGLVHLVDKRNYDFNAQYSQAQDLAGEIARKEREQKNNKTMVVGDFNMNPFEHGMHAPLAFNAMMTMKCANPRGRKIQGKTYPFFYNPMWNCFGDQTQGPSGTFYHQSSTNGIFGWNMLDQVLFRPSAYHWFKSVEIITSVGELSLANNDGRPDTSQFPDHFPLFVSLR